MRVSSQQTSWETPEMNSNEVTRLTMELETMAIMNRKAKNGSVSAERIDCKRRSRDGSMKRYMRIVWFINGNKVTRKDAAQFLA